MSSAYRPPKNSVLRSPSSDAQPAWYCLRAQPKKERIAVMSIRHEAGIEAFSPRIRFSKRTRAGRKRFVEAVFPGYVFAHCAIETNLRYLLSLRGVSGIVKYGDRIPSLPGEMVEELKERFPQADEPVEVAPEECQPGDTVTIAEGAFLNLIAVVERYLPATQRIQVLLNFLGQDVSVALSRDAVMPERPQNVRADLTRNACGASAL